MNKSSILRRLATVLLVCLMILDTAKPVNDIASMTVLADASLLSDDLEDMPNEQPNEEQNEKPSEEQNEESNQEQNEKPNQEQNEESHKESHKELRLDDLCIEKLEEVQNVVFGENSSVVLPEILGNKTSDSIHLQSKMPVVEEHVPLTSMNITKELQSTLNLLVQSIPAPEFSVIGGEWTILTLARANHPVPDGYFESYLGRIHQMIENAEGILHHVRRTDYSRLIVALNALGEDATDVVGYDLTARILNLDDVVRQGINGPIWALIALSSIDYEGIEGMQAIQQQYIAYILDEELPTGGWALAGSQADPDITAMALYALAPYVSNDNTEIDLAINRALTRLSELQRPDGGFISWGSLNSQSSAQVIIALTSLGIDPVTDSRFVVNGNNPLTALLTFYVPGGGFGHHSADELNGMSTEQGVMALVAYDRFVRGQNPLFNMRDANMGLDEPIVPELTPKPEAVVPKPEAPVSKPKNPNPKPKDPNPKPKIPPIFTPRVDQMIRESDHVAIGEGNDDNKKFSSKKSVNDNARQAIVNNNKTNNAAGDDFMMTSLSVRELYRGEGFDSIPNNIRAVAVSIDDIPKGTMLVFNEEVNLYFSEEITNKYEQPTYLLIVNVEISDEDLKNPANYSVVADKKAEEIIFGDTNGSGRINAQDALNVITAGKAEDEIMTEQQILTMNVNFDSRVDLLDALAIMESFVSHRAFPIIENEEY